MEPIVTISISDFKGTYNKMLPYILLGCISIICGILSLLLPETKDKALPEHISQVKPLVWFCKVKKPEERNRQEENGYADSKAEL